MKFVFTNINVCPRKVVFGTLHSVRKSLEKAQNETLVVTNDTNTGVNSGDNTGESPLEETFPYMCLPYMGIKGENIIKKLEESREKGTAQSGNPQVTFKGKKSRVIF